MLWWFLILAGSTFVVVSVAAALYVQVRRQMKNAAGRHKAEVDHLEDQPPHQP